MSSSISVRDQKILWGRSSNLCAMCPELLIVEAEVEGDRDSLIGVMAHIKGEKPTAARYDSNMTNKERNSYENRILVCPNHHKMIDDQPNKYTVEKLHEIKEQHEKQARQKRETLSVQEIGNVTFVELEAVTRYVISVRNPPSEPTTIPPQEKIKKNDLSRSVERLIKIGVAQADLVEKFINRHDDLDFGERLKSGFVLEYERLKNQVGLAGDDLFNELYAFASGGSQNPTEQAAGLAVLVYLFSKCEVFEG